MAAHERIIPKTSIASSSLLQKFVDILPKDISFKIHHLSSPPTRTAAIYSAPPGAHPDRTYCESHFLAASINVPASGSGGGTEDVLVFAIEVLIYSTLYETTFFVSKADSTGYLHRLNLPKGTPSPLRDISMAFLQHLVEQHQRPKIRSVISLFARAQDQYLFPGSIEYSGKHVLDDRGLVRWWCRVLDPLIGDSNTQSSPSGQWDSAKGYLIVPGLDSYETSSCVPQRTPSNTSAWTMGHPLEELSRHPKDIPPRCLVPHFPDDPKARFLDELDDEITKGSDKFGGHWRSVKTIEQFWDMMAFRQECSAGRMVGFIWIVFNPKVENALPEVPSESTIATADGLPWDDDCKFTTGYPALPLTPTLSCAPCQSQTLSSPLRGAEDNLLRAATLKATATSEGHVTPKKKMKMKKLTGPIVSRAPKIKTENKNYVVDIPESTAYYSWPSQGRGQVIVDESDYKRITELLLRLDFANLELATSGSRRWTSEVRSGATGDMKAAWGQTVTGTRVFLTLSLNNTTSANNLNAGLVRKKRKAVPEDITSAPNLPASAPVVNVLGAGMIRKKAKFKVFSGVT